MAKAKREKRAEVKVPRQWPPLRVWRDESHKSQGEVLTEPNTWVMYLPDFRISVHRWIYEPGFWFVSVYGILVRYTVRLTATRAEEAKAEALAWVRALLVSMIEELPK